VSVVHGTTQRSQFALAHDSALEHARQSLLLGRYEDTLKQIKMARQIPGYERSPLALELKSSMATHLVRKEFCDAWQLRTFQHRRELTSVSFSDDNRRIHAGDQATMGVWDISTGKWLHAVRLDTPESIGYYYAMAFTSDSKYAFVADYDEVRAFDLASGRVMQTYRGHTSSFGLSGSVNAMALSKDNRYLLTGSCDCTVRLWDVASGNCLRTFTGHNDHVKFVSLSADRRFAISGGDDRTVRLWDTNSGDCLHRIEMHASSAAFRSDGRYALLGGADMRLWDISSGKWLRTVKGATSPVALSDDGQYALSGSHDNTVCLWNLRTSQCLRVFSGHIECVTTVAFGANCSLALSGSADKTVRLWALDWDFGVPQPGAAE
jgi:WD40 repeat protein